MHYVGRLQLFGRARPASMAPRRARCLFHDISTEHCSKSAWKQTPLTLPPAIGSVHRAAPLPKPTILGSTRLPMLLESAPSKARPAMVSSSSWDDAPLSYLCFMMRLSFRWRLAERLCISLLSSSASRISVCCSCGSTPPGPPDEGKIEPRIVLF